MRTRDRLTTGLGLLALLTSVLAIGGAHRYIVVIIGLLAVAAAATQIGSRRRLDGVSPLLLFLGTAIALTALQLIPLPEGLRSLLDGTGNDLVSDGKLLLATDDGGWRPLSLDPPATLVELAKFCAYFLIAWVALRAAASDRGRIRLLAAVAGTAGVVVVIAIIHELLDADALYGIYDPKHVTPVVMAPLLNANHLSCLMAVGAILSIGLALHEKKVPVYRVLWIAIAIGCIGVLLASRSRGGVIGFGAGSVVAAVLVVLQRLKASGEAGRKDVLRVAIPAAFTVLCTLVLVVSIGGGKVSHDLSNTQLEELSDPRSKFAAWGSSIELFKEAPILGIGRGAFETDFTRVHAQSGRVTFSHVENEYLQTLLDWGLLGAIAFALAIGFAGKAVLRRWHRGSLAAVGIGGIAAVGVQSLVDFGLELPGVAVPVIVVASTLLYVPLKESTRTPKRQLFRILACAGAAIVLLISGSERGITVGEDHDDLHDKPTLELAEQAFERHPVDYLSAAIIGSTSKEPEVQIAFVNHALRLHPTHPDLHLVVARWLAATKRFEQSAFEYRQAMVRDLKTELLVDDILARLPPEHVPAALPINNEQSQRILKALIDRQKLDIAVTYLQVAATADMRRSNEFWTQLFTLSKQQGKNELTLRAARQLAILEPSPTATIRIAEAQVALGDHKAALATLAPLIAQTPSTSAHVDAHVLRCNTLVSDKDWPEAKKCLTRVIEIPITPILIRKMMHGQLAKVEFALGNERAANLERELAGERSPDGIKEIEPKKP